MAYKATITDELIQLAALDGVSHFWAIHRGVGWGYDNNYDDVLLIQFLLNSDGANLVQDGVFGKKTQHAIKAFQKKWKGYVFSDGKVDANDGSQAGFDLNPDDATDLDRIYTIFVLNYSYLDSKRIYYNDLRMDPKLPQPLAHLLSL
jgi:peptidoglycan hydrolase-like protein with peptidoglycan-binding domain